MDLEDELRQAMAEHVAGASAPASLASDVRRRHRRRVARVRATIAGAAVLVVAVTVTPAYQTFRADPAGAPRTTAEGGGTIRSDQNSPGGGNQQLPVSGSPSPPPSLGEPGTGTPRPLVTPPSNGGGRPSTSPDVSDSLPRWITYMPSGLRAAKPCLEKSVGEQRTVNCRWTGPDGWVEIHLTRAPGLAGPGDLAGKAPLAGKTPTTVHGRPAVRADRPDGGRQLTWVERTGVGVVVAVGSGLNGQLMRIAEGIRP